MALQLVLGSSGSGKSHQLYHRIIRESIHDTKTNYIIIVPEQFTMETQKDLVSMHPSRGIVNIDILSFMRLAYRVFDEVGEEERTVLNDVGKTMILRKVVEGKKKNLGLFATNIKKRGFIDELKSLLSEMIQYDIQEEQLEQMIEISNKKPMLQEKLRDILTIYQGFKEYMREKYITAEEIMEVLYDLVDTSAVIANSVICFDGFTGFTPSQYKVLGKLMKVAKKIYVTVTIDPREDISRVDEEFKLFHLSKKTICRLYSLALEEKVEIEEEYYMGSKGEVAHRFRESSPLGFLEQNLFRYPNDTFVEEQEDIGVHVLRDPKQEVYFTIRKINQLVREKGWRYRDIAVVSGAMEVYGPLIEKEYNSAGLPFFIDNKKDILSNPLVELIRSVLEILQKDFDYESIFRYLRCGLVDLSLEDVDILENYVLALGIRGYQKWKQPWTRVYRKGVSVDLERVNEIREKVMEPLGVLKEQLTGKVHRVDEYTKVLYEFIVGTRVFEKLECFRQGFEQERKPLLAKEYMQVYPLVMELFEQLVELLGEEEVSVKEYEDLVESGFAEAKVGFIPPGVDQIVVGDIERTRLKNVKALFFIGVNDGVIPKVSTGGGILSDLEREVLLDHHLEMAPTKRQAVYTEQFYLYLNLTKPEKFLFLTFSKVGQNGKALRPSYLIGKIEKIFPSLCIQDEERVEEDVEHILGVDNGRNYLLTGLERIIEEDVTSGWKELYNWYFQKEEEREELCHLVEAAFYVNQESHISNQVAKFLYGEQMSGSVSRLEMFARCGFAHFIQYGLELREREEYRLGAPDLGNIFHEAIERYSKKLLEKKLSWKEISMEERDALAEQCVREVAVEFGNTILLSSTRNQYMVERMIRMVKRTLWALSEQIKKGEFEPKGYELSFSYMDDLEATKVLWSEEEGMTLRGRIDRVDTYETQDKIYVKVIDYKSGETQFSIVDLYHGLQLQLVVYLHAALELERKNNPHKKVLPGGIFYYNMKDPLVDKGEEEQVRQAILKQLRVNGMVNRDKEVIQNMDRSFESKDGGLSSSVKSLVIPVETSKGGEVSKQSQVLRREEFENMMEFVQRKMKSFGKRIMEGETGISPYKMGNESSCKYCKFGGICGFDPRLPGYQYRNLKKMKKEDVWREINGESTVDQGPTEGN